MQEYDIFKSDDSRCEAIIYVEKLAYNHLITKLEGYNKETGGILVGYYSTSLRKVYINLFSDEPSDSKSGFSYFIRGVKGLGDFLKRKWDKCNEYYLGEWHFHPANVPEPSGIDISQLKIIASDDRFNCKEPIMIIISRKNNCEYNLTIRLFLNSIVYDFYKVDE